MSNNYELIQDNPFESLLQELKIINPKNIKNNIFQDLELDAYCFNVHDPDTISVLFKYKDDIVKYNIRLSGIDAPELHSKNIHERELCIKGTDYLKNLILNKIIKIKTHKTDKYGRMLADIFISDKCINQDLIYNGYCRMYNGGAKEDWKIEQNEIIQLNIESIKPKRKYTKRLSNSTVRS